MNKRASFTILRVHITAVAPCWSLQLPNLQVCRTDYACRARTTCSARTTYVLVTGQSTSKSSANPGSTLRMAPPISTTGDHLARTNCPRTHQSRRNTEAAPRSLQTGASAYYPQENTHQCLSTNSNFISVSVQPMYAPLIHVLLVLHRRVHTVCTSVGNCPRTHLI